MADGEESPTSEDSEDSSTSSSSEEAAPGRQDGKLSASSSQPASRRKVRAGNAAGLTGRPGNPSAAEARGGPSAASSVKSGGQPKLPMPKLDLKALFDYNSRKRQHRYRSCRGYRKDVPAKRRSPKLRAKKPLLRAPKERQRQEHEEKPFHFPFMQKLYGQKDMPLRMESLFEQAVIQGFFKCIQKQKFEHHLKKSLGQLGATADLEKESLESRSHKYLDDDGPLSPIEEANGEDMDEDGDTEDIGARIVENSCFILSEIPKKMKSKRKTKS